MSNLFLVKGIRKYTIEYLEKYPNTRDWNWQHLRWGDTKDEVEQSEAKIYSRSDSYWDKMYKDNWIEVIPISDEDLAERRKLASRYSLCCELAVLDFCVCSYKTTCPVHGQICHGSHD